MKSKDEASIIKEESNKNKIKDYLKLIRSKFILKQIFKNLQRKKLLQIIRYNKNYQKDLKLTFYDFREFTTKYSDIEIEVIPIENKCGKFINIIKKSDKAYFNIFFNNDKKIKKRNTLNELDKVEKIKIIIKYQVTSFEELFKDCECIESITFKKFYRNNITDMSYMFSGCISLKELNLDSFNTKHVTYMNHMFDNCLLLKELNLSKFRTKNVTDMSFMFYKCNCLNELNINNFDTRIVDNMNFMFDGCSSLKELNLSNFNTANVTCMIGMFSGCLSLKELNISNFNKNNVTKIQDMFTSCSLLEKLILPPGFTELIEFKIPKKDENNNNL